MSLSYRQENQLHRIEIDLRRSDRHLGAMFSIFGKLYLDQDKPTWEQVPQVSSSGVRLRRAVARFARTVRAKSSRPPGREVGRGLVNPCSAGRIRFASRLVSSSINRATRGRSLASDCSGRPPASESTLRKSSTLGVTEAGSMSSAASSRPAPAACASTSSRTDLPNSASSSEDHSRTVGNDASRPPRVLGPRPEPPFAPLSPFP